MISPNARIGSTRLFVSAALPLVAATLACTGTVSAPGEPMGSGAASGGTKATGGAGPATTGGSAGTGTGGSSSGTGGTAAPACPPPASRVP